MASKVSAIEEDEIGDQVFYDALDELDEFEDPLEPITMKPKRSKYTSTSLRPKNKTKIKNLTSTNQREKE